MLDSYIPCLLQTIRTGVLLECISGSLKILKRNSVASRIPLVIVAKEGKLIGFIL